ncbi:hypothetical protein JY97_10475 [Alkalispirochaeta odontotermitis]|nr:hypothetical protein JY97_10475 [Alkalispirochaeta odontotermitis]CAB1079017.1 hypothetical protein D1AOALGA4SA_6735 [Olavius algarvensis Delta 1 endosymbiont]
MKISKTNGHLTIKPIIAGLALALIVAGICLPAGAGEHKIKSEWDLPDHYPAVFDGYGYINRIAAEEVVIDDSLLRLSPATTYATLNSVLAVNDDFRDGDLVGYLSNSGQEIISLWLIKKGSP